MIRSTDVDDEVLPMIGWLARMALLRVLPRKLVPILTVIEVARFLRSAQRQRAANAARNATSEGNAAGTAAGRPPGLEGARSVGSSGPEPVVDGGRAGVGR